MEKTIDLKLNGKPTKVITDPSRPLLWVLRADLGITGVKYGCGEGHCGACTVLVNDQATRACQISIGEVKGAAITTIEGLEKGGQLHPLQRAFVAHDALQCGFCTPGMILRAQGLLLQQAHPSRSEIVTEMDGNLCRCGAHKRIIEAIQSVARATQGRQDQ